MDKQYLIDTNILIYYMNDEIPVASLEKLENIFQQSFHISTISKIETLGWKSISVSEVTKISAFLNYAEVLFIDENIEQKSIEIKQKKKVKTPDAIIAATAMVNDYIIVTRNESDFKNIDNLEVWNPFE